MFYISNLSKKEILDKQTNKWSKYWRHFFCGNYGGEWCGEKNVTIITNHMWMLNGREKWMKWQQIPTILSWWIFVIIIPIVIIIIKLKNRKLLYYNWNVLNVCKKKHSTIWIELKFKSKKKNQMTHPCYMMTREIISIVINWWSLLLFLIQPINQTNQNKTKQPNTHINKKIFRLNIEKTKQKQKKTSWNHELFWTK